LNGLHVSSFTWTGGAPALRNNLARIAVAAEEQGFAKLSVMDHVWQINNIGPPEQEMLEAYTTLGFLAGRTEQIELLAWVTAVDYRDPGLLAKSVTTLDVLSGGRAWLGLVPRGTSRKHGDSDCSFRHWPSASIASKKPLRSVFRCGATTRVLSEDFTTDSNARSTHRSPSLVRTHRS
jgi:alkanesulfonate monooxygenase SsuD/methylene tetrahydromethanopterin reductase-like flavin-dependent oxidoreductase (luciferase family)